MPGWFENIQAAGSLTGVVGVLALECYREQANEIGGCGEKVGC